MKKVIWITLFIEIVMVIIILLLVMLGKVVPDLIANILFTAMVIGLVACIGEERQNIIKHKPDNKSRVQSRKIYLSIVIMLIPLIIMLITNNILIR